MLRGNELFPTVGGTVLCALYTTCSMECESLGCEKAYRLCIVNLFRLSSGLLSAMSVNELRPVNRLAIEW